MLLPLACVSNAERQRAMDNMAALEARLEERSTERDQARQERDRLAEKEMAMRSTDAQQQMQIKSLQSEIRGLKARIAQLGQQLQRARAASRRATTSAPTAARGTPTASSPAASASASVADRNTVEQLRRDLGGDIRVERIDGQLRITIENRRVVLLVEDQAANGRGAAAEGMAADGPDLRR